jgi:DNA polymerase-4
MSGSKAIIHLDLDAFFVSVECLKNPKLRGKPVIVGGSGERGVVAACSYEARRFGVHSAMAGRLARQLCPEAIFLRGDFESYMRFSDMVTEVINEQAPLVEKASIDEFYIDMSGMERFIGCYKWAGDLKKRIRHEAGLNVSFGLSVNKTVSKVATNESKPNGQKYVPTGLEKDFLFPLSVNKLPMVGEKTGHKLRSMGVNTIGTLGQIPPRMLERVFGKNGISLWEKANGKDDTPVVPYSAQKSLSKESTFDKDTIDVAFLRQQIVAMVTELCYELRRMQQMTGCVTVKIRYNNFDTYTRQMNIAYTASDHKLIAVATELFDKLYQRRLMIRLVGVRLSKLIRGGLQLHLFDNSATLAPLYQAMDRIRDRYGLQAIQRASAL